MRPGLVDKRRRPRAKNEIVVVRPGYQRTQSLGSFPVGLNGRRHGPGRSLIRSGYPDGRVGFTRGYGPSRGELGGFDNFGYPGNRDLNRGPTVQEHHHHHYYPVVTHPGDRYFHGRDRGVSFYCPECSAGYPLDDGWEYQHNGYGGQRGGIFFHPRNGRYQLVRTYPTWDVHPTEGIPLEVYILRNIVPRNFDTIVNMRNFHPPVNGRGRELAVMYDYYEGGDLREYIERKGFAAIDETIVWHVFISIAEALAMFHYGADRRNLTERHRWEQVVHRDVHPSNILFTSDLPLNYRGQILPGVCLGGLQNATVARESRMEPRLIFHAPEAPDHIAKSDVWSLGALIYNMARSQIPTNGRTQFYDGRQEMLHPATDPFWERWSLDTDLYDPRLNHWMKECLVTDVSDRCSSLRLLRGLLFDEPADVRDRRMVAL